MDLGDGSIGPLPLAALRLPPELLETLEELGLEQIADLLALPREQLRSRFGPLLLTRIDQALGERHAKCSLAVDPPEEFTVEHAFDFPLARQDAMRYAVEHLLRRLAWLLVARNAGALRLRCRFDCEGAPPVAVEFGLFQPTARVRHLLEILDLHLERLRLPRRRRRSPSASSGTPRSPSGKAGCSRPNEPWPVRCASPRWSTASRAGWAASGRPLSLQSDAQPELAYREEPLVAGGLRPPLPAHPAAGGARSPVVLAESPGGVGNRRVVPDGPPIQFSRFGRRHDVARHWGPERIETGWWRRTARGGITTAWKRARAGGSGCSAAPRRAVVFAWSV